MAIEIKQPTRKMTAAELLPWVEAAQARGEPRYELIGGVPIPTSPERRIHGQTKLAVAIALLAAVRRAGLNCHVQPDGATVVAGNHKVYGPGALVYCGDPLPDDATVTPDPVVVVEVISPPAPVTSIRATSSKRISHCPACTTICSSTLTGALLCTTRELRERRSRRKWPMKASCCSTRPA